MAGFQKLNRHERQPPFSLNESQKTLTAEDAENATQIADNPVIELFETKYDLDADTAIIHQKNFSAASAFSAVKTFYFSE
jgi:hypothetical protein